MNTSVSGTPKVKLNSIDRRGFNRYRRQKQSAAVGGTRKDPKPLVVYAEDRDVIPRPLCAADPEKNEGRPLDKFYSSRGSNYSKSASVTNLHTPRLPCSSFLDSGPQSIMSLNDSWTRDIKDILSMLDMNLNPPAPCTMPLEKDSVDKHLTEEMLNELVEIVLTESDTLSLLDKSPTCISVEDDDAKAAKGIISYAEIHENRMVDDMYVDQTTQTFGRLLKTKQFQIKNIMADEAATGCNIHDVCEQNKPTERFQDSTVSTRRMNKEPDSISWNSDPEWTTRPGFEEHREENEDSSSAPKLERLWVFDCDLIRGYSVTCLTWNKKNPDVLAAGYADWESGSPKPGVICCWSLKNRVWPEHVISCPSSVMSLDFSATNPNQLAVGMHDGSVAIYNVQTENSRACMTSSQECSTTHLHPVWQVIWTKKTDEEREALVSVSTDGRIIRWLFGSSVLDCEGDNVLSLWSERVFTDPKLKKVQKPAESLQITATVLLSATPALCAAFHSTDVDICLVGTRHSQIHKLSLFNSERFLDTYQKHSGPVTHVEWSPFSPDVFLSCSADWTIQLWKHGVCTPKMSFSSVKSTVHRVHWSPNSSVVFAALYMQRVEIWDLNSDIMCPIIVHRAASGVTLTSLLFVEGSDCILVGDSEGHVTVYKLKNLRVREGNKVECLDDMIQSVSSSAA